jgi:tetratricopeptide (TPR) repeat protein
MALASLPGTGRRLDSGVSAEGLWQKCVHEGRRAHRQALAVDEKLLGADHPKVAADLNDLALLYDAQGNFAQAEALLSRALRICEKAYGEEHPGVIPSLEYLATFLRRTRRPAEAQKVEARAKAIRARLGPKAAADPTGPALLPCNPTGELSRCA